MQLLRLLVIYLGFIRHGFYGYILSITRHSLKAHHHEGIPFDTHNCSS